MSCFLPGQSPLILTCFEVLQAQQRQRRGLCWALQVPGKGRREDTGAKEVEMSRCHAQA